MSKNHLLTLIAAIGLSTAALPALADNVFFSISSGGHGFHQRDYGRRDYGRHHNYYAREHFRPWHRPHFYGRDFYEPRRVVYIQQPHIIERRIIVEQPIRANAGRVISNNPYCREYQRDVRVGNRVQESYGTACRQPDGAWKIVDGED